MKFLKYLSEEYYKRVGKTEILVNPSPKELLKTYGNNNMVRWISNWKKKEIYVWDSEKLHYTILDNCSELEVNCLVRGTAIIHPNGKLYTDTSEDITSKPGIKKPYYKGKLDFLQKYFDEDIVARIYNAYDNDVAEHGEEWLKQWWR